MSWQRPELLWLGLSLPAIAVLYLLRLQRRRRRIASTLLWPAARREQSADRPWQRLRSQPLLWLQLLTAALLTLAAAGPLVGGQAAPALVVLLDRSASMQARDVHPSRLAAAEAVVRGLAAGLRGGGRLTVIAFTSAPQVLVQNATSAAAVDRALQGLQPSNAAGDLAPALALAGAVAQRAAVSRIVLVSDGDLPSAELALPAGASFRYVPVGRSGANIALQGLYLRREAGALAAQVLVHNAGAAPAAGTVSLTAGGRQLGAKRWRLPGGGQAALLWPSVPATGPLQARLAVDNPSADVLALDDVAWAVPPGADVLRALLVTPGNTFLDQALRTVPGLQLDLASPADYRHLAAAGGLTAYGLVVLDRSAAAPGQGGAVLWVDPVPGDALLASRNLKVGGGFAPRPPAAAAQDPLLSYVDPSDVHTQLAERLTAGPSWQADWTAGPGGPGLLLHRQGARTRSAVLAFDVHRSDLPLRPAFPVLVQNLAAWLAPPPLAAPDGARTGVPLVLNAPPQASSLTVLTPSGQRLQLAPPFPPRAFTPDALGIYRVVAAGGPGGSAGSAFAVNPPGDLELAPRPTAPVQMTAGAAQPLAAAPPPPARSLAVPLILAALVLALIEWGVASRA